MVSVTVGPAECPGGTCDILLLNVGGGWCSVENLKMIISVMSPDKS